MCSISFAQSGSIRGSLLDNDDSSIIKGATIALELQLDSSVVTNIVSDVSGNFLMNNLNADSFIVKISIVGYQEYVSFITLNENEKNLGTIRLNKQGKDLAGVTVTAKTPPVIQKGDTSQFSASQYKVNPDATTEDLIKKMPGITVDKDGTVTAQGEQVKKVTI
ncbi:MAG: carboxypeptidase regulatory-like domain-containing protein, partial [Ferruginibacter sp.]